MWSGSTNWTDDAWSRQENVIVVVESPKIAADFRRDFDQLLSGDAISRTGEVEPLWSDGIRAWFTPGHGEDLSHRIAQAIGQARRRVRLCSPVLTAPPVLGAVVGAIAGRRIDIAGCLDGPQAREVAYQWRRDGAHWKVPLLERLALGAFSAKQSTPYGSGSVHDFMHAKLTVTDDTVFVGSFNLSRSGERNAENVIEFVDAALADQLAAYVDTVRARYGPLTL